MSVRLSKIDFMALRIAVNDMQIQDCIDRTTAKGGNDRKYAWQARHHYIVKK